MIVDSHAHLDMHELATDLPQVLARAKRNDVTHIVTIGADISSSQKAVEISREYPDIFAAVGFHPHDAKKVSESDYITLKKLCSEPGVVAIGEMGLDYYRNLSPGAVQVEVFKCQLKLALELDLPIIIHCRQAHQNVLEILRDWSKEKGKKGKEQGKSGVIHCFSGNLLQAREYADMRFLLSVSGQITYPGSSNLQEAVSKIPLEYLLIETDAPFLTPQKYRGRKNEPGYIVEVAQKIAEVKNIPFQQVCEATTRNAFDLFRIKQ